VPLRALRHSWPLGLRRLSVSILPLQVFARLAQIPLRRKVAGHELASPELTHDRFLDSAAGLSEWAACVEAAARGWRNR